MTDQTFREMNIDFMQKLMYERLKRGAAMIFDGRWKWELKKLSWAISLWKKAPRYDVMNGKAA